MIGDETLDEIIDFLAMGVRPHNEAMFNRAVITATGLYLSFNGPEQACEYANTIVAHCEAAYVLDPAI